MFSRRGASLRSRMSPSFPLWLFALLLLAACVRRGELAPERPPEVHIGPLLQLVPPGLGQAWVVTARPKELAQHASARAVWRAVVEEPREQAFVQRTGVDPLAVEEVVAVEVPPNGYVLLARGPFDAADIVRRAGERIALPDVTSDEPLVRREGLRGDGRYAYVELDSHALLVAKDAPPELLGEFLARRLDAKRPRAFDAHEAHALEMDHAASPLVAYRLSPLAFEQASPIALLFSRQRALALVVKPVEDALYVSLDLRGEFPPGAETNFRTLARSLGQAPLGSALGLARIAEEMSVRLDTHGVLLSTRLDVGEVLSTLRMMLAKEVRELLE